MVSSTLINNNNEFISQYLLDKFKLWVWDFDDTLIDTTTYYKKSMEPEDIIQRTNEELTIDFPNWKYFRNLVQFIVSRGIRVGIASFGTYNIIKAYMDRIFGLNQKIFTKCNLKALCRDPTTGKPTRFYPNKNDFIDNMMDHFRIYEPLKVILFDDNITNIAEALAVGLVSVKIKGKTNNNINQYTKNTDDVYFGKIIVNQLEETLKRLEEEEKKKKGCPSNNLKNERFSSIGSRAIGTINKANRIARENFLRSIKKKSEAENVEKTKEEYSNINSYLENHIPIQSIEYNKNNLDMNTYNNNNDSENIEIENAKKKIENIK